MSISTLSFSNASRSSILRLQTEIRDSTQEVNTERHADVGRTLGRLTGSAVSARVKETSIDKILESNKLVTSRLKLADKSMETIAGTAESLLGSLINGTKDATSIQTALDQSASGLKQLTGALNLNIGGQYIFGGDQTDRLPITDYDTALPAAADTPRQATRDSLAAFVAATGALDLKSVEVDDVKAYFSAAGYTDAAMVVHRFDDLFSPSSWDATWSNASDATIQSSISKTETVASSLSANEEAFRNIASAYSLLNDAGLAGLGEATLKVVKDTAYAKLKTGIDQITRVRADLGVKLARIDRSDEALVQQKDILTATVASLEEVDVYEASQRVLRLETQLQAALTITGRLQKLNILDYI